MKLNPETVRDVMLFLENALQDEMELDMKHNELTLYQIANNEELTSKHSVNDLAYTVTQLIERGYLNAIRVFTKNGVIASAEIVDITSEGHDFISNIRNEDTWSKTKKKLSPVGSVSLTIISEVAASVIKSTLGLS